MIVAYAADNLTISANQTVVFNDPGKSVLLLNQLDIAGDTSGNPLGTFDLTNRDVIIQCDSTASAATMMAQINVWLRSGYNATGALWTGTGIMSSAAAADESCLEALGLLNNTETGDPIYTEFDGVPVNNNSILLKYTYVGDSNLDGTVNLDDYNSIDFAWMPGHPGQSWGNGDFDYSGGAPNLDDYNLIDWGYAFQGAAMGAPTGTPKTLATSNPLHINEAAVTDISGPVVATTGNLIYTVTFNKPVAGVDATDFSLVTTGDITGNSVIGVSGSGSSYTLTVAPGSGWGTLRVDLVDDDSIHDALANKLGGDGLYNGDFEGPTLQPSVTQTGSTTGTEGSPITLTLGTDFYTMPSATTWEVDWGDGLTTTTTGSAPTFSHNYTTGDGVYAITYNAVDPDGATLYSDFVPVSVVPSAAQAINGTASGQDSVTLTWTASSDLASAYRVEVSMDGGESYQLVADGITQNGTSTFSPQVGNGGGAGGGGQISYTVNGLTSGTTYAFHVTAYNTAGNSAVAASTGSTLLAPASSGALSPVIWPPDQDNYQAWLDNVHLGFQINFWGFKMSSLTIYNNGHVGGYDNWGDVPTDFGDAGFIMAPFFGPVAGGAGNQLAAGDVTYGPETFNADNGTHNSYAIHWNAVQYYLHHDTDVITDPNTFSLNIVDRSDTGPGNFDMVYTYGDMGWDGLSYSGLQGAKAGYANGSERPLTYEGFASGEAVPADDLANTQIVREVRNPEAHIKLTDLAPGGQFITDTSKGILGVVQDDQGNAQVKLELSANAPSAEFGVKYYYELSGPEHEVGVMPSSGSINFTTEHSGLYTLTVTNDWDSAFVESVDFYSASLNIVWAGADTQVPNCATISSYSLIMDKTIDVFAGEHIVLDYSLDVASLATQLLPKWSGAIGSDLKTFLTATDQSYGYRVPLSSSDLGGPRQRQLTLYAVDDATRKFALNLSAKIGGKTVVFNGSTTIRVHKPGQSIWNGPSAIPGNSDLFKISGIQFGPSMTLGTSKGDLLTGATVGWQVSLPLTGYVGSVQCVQLVKGAWLGTNFPARFNTDERWMLDSGYPYTGGENAALGSHSWGDAPDAAQFNATWIEMTLHFRDWFMWKAPDDAIYVPIQKFTWDVRAKVLRSSSSSPWSPLPPAAPITLTGDDTSLFPGWTALYHH